MYDSRSDQPHGGNHFWRKVCRRENLFVGYDGPGGVLYRRAHQEPAVDVDEGPFVPEWTMPGIPDEVLTRPAMSAMSALDLRCCQGHGRGPERELRQHDRRQRAHPSFGACTNRLTALLMVTHRRLGGGTSGCWPPSPVRAQRRGPAGRWTTGAAVAHAHSVGSGSVDVVRHVG
jgi:hypothetical protein